MISRRQKDALRRCIAARVPFALYAFQGDSTFHFIASEVVVHGNVEDLCSDEMAHGFAVNLWGTSECYIIKNRYDEFSLPSELAECPNVECAIENDTTRSDYERSGSKVVDMLRKEGGKIVLSRVIRARGGNPVAVAADYFCAMNDTFRCIYFIPDTGLWICATPELLGRYDASTKKVNTMSLAGTRLAGSVDDWDLKNRDEHEYVTGFIVETLRKYSSGPVSVSPPESLRFGSVEHLCEKISAERVSDFGSLIGELSPTPAVGGVPRERALHVIAELEHHQRRCYGGWIAAGNGNNRIEVCVNLRCCQVFRSDECGWVYAVYAGGGFTAESNVNEEWYEGSRKAAPLLKSIQNSLNDE